ncbi:hypothetical protein D3C87_1505400 [compost metagenome]
MVIFRRPVPKRADRLLKGLAKFGEAILHPGRHFGIDGPRDQAVALEIAQRQGQHALRYTVDQALEFVEPQRAIAAQHADHHDAPLVADAIEHVRHGRAVGVLRSIGQ